MISYLKGKIIKLDTNSVNILLESGIGYEVWINELTYSKINIGENIDLFIYHYITEVSQNLFGFLEDEEKEIFKELIKISGIGGKVALSILSMGINRLIIAIKNEDKKTIEQIKGIGNKMASKIILELKDKDFVKTFILGENEIYKKTKVNKNFKNYENIKMTLVGMGYNQRDVENLLNNLPEEINTTEKIIPYIIKNLS